MTPRALKVAGRPAGGVLLSRERDERLLDLSRAGSAAAFDELVARHRPLLLGYCRRILPPERAEDAVQVTFMRAYERLGQFHDEAAFRAWLYTVAHNVAIDGLRDRGYGHSRLDETVEGIDRPDVMAERHERVRDVVVAIQDLPENQRDAMVLSAFEGRSYDEISGTLGVTRGATRQLLARARLTLRRAAAAVLPLGLLQRPLAVPGEGALTGWRFAELAGTAGAGASTMMAQVGAGAVLTAGALGGLAAATGPGPSGVTPVAGSARASAAPATPTPAAASPAGPASEQAGPPPAAIAPRTEPPRADPAPVPSAPAAPPTDPSTTTHAEEPAGLPAPPLPPPSPLPLANGIEGDVGGALPDIPPMTFPAPLPDSEGVQDQSTTDAMPPVAVPVAGTEGQLPAANRDPEG